MNPTEEQKLTAAEAGFLYLANNADTSDRGRKLVDEIAAPTLVEALDDDESPKMGSENTEIRQWIQRADTASMGAKLVILGATLVAKLERRATRRRLAALLRELPPDVGEQVRERLDELPPMEARVERRINEVYGRIAAGRRAPDEELAMVGLFFVVSAGIFRQNRVLDELESRLPPALRRRCRKYRRACLRSHQPELTAAIADTIRPLLT